MKNLKENELKIDIKNKILKALKESKAVSLEINFIFKSTHKEENFKYTEKIEYFACSYKYKNVYFDSTIVNTKTILEIILDNFNYSDFTFIDQINEIGKIECHGHGEYWSEDKIYFIYQRIN